MPRSGPASRANAFSSVTSSPMNMAAVAPAWWRSTSRAWPLSVCTTASSITALPSVTCTPVQVAGPERTAFSTASACSGAALRTCTATLAGLTSSCTPGWSATSALQRAAQPPVQRLGLLVQRVHEAHVELGPVAADQVHLGGQPGQRGQVAQGAAGDDGGGGLVQAGQRAQRANRFRSRPSLLGVFHDGRQRAVVVAGHQQSWRPGEPDDGTAQFRRKSLGGHS